jgi:hypothetical protein
MSTWRLFDVVQSTIAWGWDGQRRMRETSDTTARETEVMSTDSK